MSDEGEPWDWIPHTKGADRQKEINAYLREMVDRMPFAPPVAAIAKESDK